MSKTVRRSRFALPYVALAVLLHSMSASGHFVMQNFDSVVHALPSLRMTLGGAVRRAWDDTRRKRVLSKGDRDVDVTHLSPFAGHAEVEFLRDYSDFYTVQVSAPYHHTFYGVRHFDKFRNEIYDHVDPEILQIHTS